LDQSLTKQLKMAENW